MKNIQYILNKSEITAGTRGASLGPEAIFAAARTQQDLFFQHQNFKHIQDTNHLLDNPDHNPHAKRIQGLISVFEQLNVQVADTLKKEQFPFLIAADHGSAGGTICGIKSAFPNAKLGIVWIDAHADIHTPFTTPSGNMHGMPLGTVIGDDNLECQRNDLNASTLAHWETLKKIGFDGPKFHPDHLVYVAVRDTEPEEEAIMKRLAIKNYTVDEVRTLKIQGIVAGIQNRLKDCTHVYVSFDVDSMDPDLTSYGTGTPVKNGLTVEEAKELLTQLVAWEKTVCFEIVEVNPCLDEKKNKMAEIAFEIIKDVAAVIAAK